MGAEVRESLCVSHESPVTGTEWPSVFVHVTSLDSLRSDPRMALVMIDGPPGTDAIRVDLFAASDGDEGDGYLERLYLIRAVFGGEVLSNGFLIEPAADLAWTAGDQAVVGDGETGLWAGSVEVSNAGRLLARVGVDVAASPIGQSPASVTIYDAGPAIAVLRVMQAGEEGASKVRGLHAKWT